MEITESIYKILLQDEVMFNDGTKKIKGGFVIMRKGDYPKPVAFEFFGEERLSTFNGLNLGMPVKVSFYAESRAGKDGKYYTSLRCTNLLTLPPVQPREVKTPLPETDELTVPVSPDDNVLF